ncbi:hypothetical protein [Nocardiopsis tropica]|uniref:MFS transporter n=1 Tax=Nocardiopsis tropica TaxID=109330 RepID=A0ABU7KMX4_9ACTN|nr:hypothetical protein [Nocardiopsis umidischolae]MEE2050643.1 hypothetical protein [Nocardiopsis umidischolae]
MVLPLAWGGVGFVGAHLNVAVTSYTTSTVPAAVLGRVSSTLDVLAGAAMPVGLVADGYAVQTLGPQPAALTVTAVIAVLAVAATALIPSTSLSLPPRPPSPSNQRVENPTST